MIREENGCSGQAASRALIMPITFFAQGMVGVFHTLLGTALPAMRATLAMDLIQAGTFGAAAWVGFTLSILAGGVLSDLFRRQRILMLGCAMMGVGAFFVGGSTLFPLNCLLIALTGAGTGVVTSSSSALVMGLYPGREGLVVNGLHFCYALGTIAGATGMTWAIGAGWDWRWVYRGGASLLAVIAALFGVLRIRLMDPSPSLNYRAFLSLLGEKKMVLLILIALFGVGNQNAFSLWLVSFLKDVRSMTIFTAGWGMTLFSAGMMVGRLMAGGLSLRVGHARILLVSSGFLAGVLLLLTQVTGTASILWACFLAGIGFSGIFPLILALGGINFPDCQGTAVGILGTAAGLGSTVFPWLISRVSEYGSLSDGLRVSLIAAFLVFVLLIRYRREL